MAQAYINQ